MATFVLVGPHAEKTGNFGGHRFVKGFFQYTGQTKNILPTLERHLKRFGGFIVGTDAHEHAVACWEATQANQELPPAPVLPVPEPADPGVEPIPVSFVNTKLVDAIKSLDASDYRMWTKDGLPLLGWVEKSYGQGGLNRRVVSEALPGWNREAAKAAQAGQEGAEEASPQPATSEPIAEASTASEAPVEPVTEGVAQ